MISPEEHQNHVLGDQSVVVVVRKLGELMHGLGHLVGALLSFLSCFVQITINPCSQHLLPYSISGHLVGARSPTRCDLFRDPFFLADRATQEAAQRIEDAVVVIPVRIVVRRVLLSHFLWRVDATGCAPALVAQLHCGH